MNSATGAAATSAAAAIASTATRQPQSSTSHATSGRNTSWPLAVLADSSPITSPRSESNQRVATVAPSASAVIPVPPPTTTPHNSTNCQLVCMSEVAATPTASSSSASTISRRNPSRLTKAALKGAISP